MSEDSGSDRLPMPAPAELTAEQLAAVEQIVSGPRGTINGPFVPLLRSPELMTRVQMVGEYLRFSSVLDDDLVELVILLVARMVRRRRQTQVLERSGKPSAPSDPVFTAST